MLPDSNFRIINSSNPTGNPTIPTKIPANSINPPPAVGPFSFNASGEQFVVMVLDKVDPVYVTESRNAYKRYNQQKYPQQAIEIIKDALDQDRNLLIFSKFADANTAFAYEEQIKKDAANEISWLPASKYSFLIISDANLQLLKANKDLATYKTLLNSKFPGKF